MMRYTPCRKRRGMNGSRSGQAGRERSPIRRLVVPHEDELQEWGSLDASNEAKYTVLPGLEHKYPDTVVLLINNVCGALCRFCFRKKLFLKGNQEVSRNTARDIQYIRKHTEIRNVLLTGGDDQR